MYFNNMLTDEQIRENKEKIIEYLRSTKREGIETLISFLNESGYFYLYGSFKHHKYKGGLAEHSLEVLEYALKNNKNCSRNSIIICALMHDLCKVKYEYPEELDIHGHGTKSVKILETFLGFHLTYAEYNAIRFHMGSKSFLRNDEDKRRIEDAKKSPLWELIHIGDCISAGRYHESLHGTVKNIIKFFEK